MSLLALLPLLARLIAVQTGDPSPHDLLDRLRNHYESQPRLTTSAEIEVATDSWSRHFEIDCQRDGGGLLLDIWDPDLGQRLTLRRSGDGRLERFDSRSGRTEEVGSPSLPSGSEQTPSLPPGSEQTPSLPSGSEQTLFAGVGRLLGLPAAVPEALIIERLLAGEPAQLAAPLAATFEQPQACIADAPKSEAREACIVAVSGPAELDCRLDVDPVKPALNRLDCRQPSLTTRSRDVVRITVNYITQETSRGSFDQDIDLSDYAAQHPKAPVEDAPDRPLFAEVVSVQLIQVRARVIDRQGQPIRNLDIDDFEARFGREPAKVVGVDWVEPTAPLGNDLPAEIRARYNIPVAPPGGLVVFFVQADFAPVRIAGHLRMLPRAVDLAESLLAQEDRIAVVSFDSHLKIRQDFTRDLEAIRPALLAGMRTAKSKPISPGRFPSLARHLDRAEGRKVTSPEQALEVVAKALKELSGDKTLVFLGWGLGRYGMGGVSMTPAYSDARRALHAADTSVFVLDVTDADYHSLEVGLEQVARDTGGTYAKTNIFPDQALKKLKGTLSGYYWLSLEKPESVRSKAKLRLELVGHRGSIHFEELELRQSSR